MLPAKVVREELTVAEPSAPTAEGSSMIREVKIAGHRHEGNSSKKY